MSNEHIIPAMDDHRGFHWSQPLREDVLVNDVEAVMDKHSYNMLSKYLTTNPSGVYPGKMWIGWDNNNQQEVLCWYSSVSHQGGKGVCFIKHRRLVVMDWKSLMGAA